MPIRKEEFDEGKTWDSLEVQILSYLSQNQSNAFSLTEISNFLGYKAEIKDLGGLIEFSLVAGVIQNSLNQLIREKKIIAKKVKTSIGEQIYYMAR